MLGTLLEAHNETALAQQQQQPYGKFLVETIKAFSQLFLITAIISLFSELYLRRSMLNDFKRETETILEKFFNKALDSSVRYGFVGISDSLDFESFFRNTNPGDTVLWLDTYAPGHAQWLSAVEEKALAGVNFKFLALKPNSYQAKLRSVELGGRFQDTFDAELKMFIFDLHEIAKRVNQKRQNAIEIKIYEDLLAIPFYIRQSPNTPDFAATSFYLRQATGITFPHLEWRHNDGGFVAALIDYFEWKWNEKSEEITTDIETLCTDILQ